MSTAASISMVRPKSDNFKATVYSDGYPSFIFKVIADFVEAGHKTFAEFTADYKAKFSREVQKHVTILEGSSESAEWEYVVSDNTIRAYVNDIYVYPNSDPLVSCDPMISAEIMKEDYKERERQSIRDSIERLQDNGVSIVIGFKRDYVMGDLGHVSAECHSDDNVYQVKFNAAHWLQQAKPAEIAQLLYDDCKFDYSSDVVAQFTASINDAVADMFKHIERVNYNGGYQCGLGKETCGFGCSIDENELLSWLQEYTPDVFNDPDMSTAEDALLEGMDFSEYVKPAEKENTLGLSA